MSERKEKIQNEILKLAATFLDRESDKTSLITVTHVDISPDFKNSTIYLSVLPDNKEEHALYFAKRKMSDFKQYLKEKMRIKAIPFFDVKIDVGEKNRRRIEELLHEASATNLE